MRKHLWLLLFFIVPALAQSPAPTGIGFYGPMASAASCVAMKDANNPNLITLCPLADGTIATNSVAAPTVFAVRGGTLAPVLSVFGRQSNVTAQTGDYSFAQISGMITAGQLPPTSTCHMHVSGLTQDGLGNADGTATFSACK